MGFKLVRTDSVEPCKIQLTNGRHVFGRGTLLKCDDEKVATHHGELIVTEDTVTVKALDQNQCYILKKGCGKKVVEKDSEMQLENGDRFGLTADSYWYELYYVANDNKHQGAAQMETEATSSEEAGPFKSENMDDSQENKNSDKSDVNVSTDSPSLLSPEDQDTASADKETSPRSKSPTKRSIWTDNASHVLLKKPRML